MRGNRRLFALGLAASLSAAAFHASRAIADPPWDIFHTSPKQCDKPTVENLARTIDCVEDQINTYGTVVAKQPDVWGESRLTRHRDEFEQEMAKELPNFQVRINAALSRSDEAFLGAAAALQSAATGTPAGSTSTGSSTSSSTSTAASAPAQPFSAVQGLIGDPNSTTNLVPRTAPTNFFATGSTAPSVGFFNNENPSLSLEPEVILEQKSRYLLYLQELRRINEGDDTHDSPGYSLNLIRIPISVIPGKKTRKGYGAEVTITAEPFLSPELLPMTFRSLVINDVVDQLSRDVTVFLNLPKSQFLMKVLRTALNNNFGGGLDALGNSTDLSAALYKIVNDTLHDPRFPDLLATAHSLYPDIKDEKYLAQACLGGLVSGNFATIPSQARPFQRPLPPSSLGVAYGEPLLLVIDNDVDNRLRELPTNSLARQVLDVRSLLQEETAGAYEMLRQNPKLFNFCTPQLLCAIQRGERSELKQMRQQFRFALPEEARATVQACLAWAIIVHATLLNQRLNDDIREASVVHNYPIPMPPNGLCLFPPNPDPATRQIFNEYVRCRWPIHVFALDPVTQDENVADAFSRRREEQLSMALAFTSGKISASAMSRYDRRLEWDMATIALNRTVVGFSHGNDTFGWRFYPRFQTPPIKGSIVTFGETLLGGPTTDQDIRDRMLEEGMRECSAVVVMPSFVPFVTVRTRANWFKLTNPGRTELSMSDTMQLSKQIKSMENASMQLCNAPQFRDGETDLLVNRVHQLSAQLPLQSMLTQVPIENTLGGFEMFNNGVTDLAPELIGWYGAPGINQGESTVLFLVGDHFSVHDTDVTAGGQHVSIKLLSRQIMQATIPPGVHTINLGPANSPYDPVNPSATKDGLVAVHVATPYGISSTLEIPLVAPGPPAQNFRWDPQNYAADYRWTLSGTPKAASIVATMPMLPNQMTITVPPNAFAALSQAATLFLTDEHNRSLGTVPVTLALDSQSRRYVIAGADFQSVQTAIASAIPGLFPAEGNQPQQLPTSLTVKVFARFSPPAPPAPITTQMPAIDGSAYIYIRLEQVQ